MVRVPTKSCPNLHRVFTEAPAYLVARFLTAKAFQKTDWLDAYRFDSADGAGASHAARMLADQLKSNLVPLESEAARVIKISAPRGQLALDGIVVDLRDDDLKSDFVKSQDELGRSLWFYTIHYRLFEAAENALHLRLYRRYDRHYQTFLAAPTGSNEGNFRSDALTGFIQDLERQLDRGKGTSVDRFDLAEDGEEPPAEMYLIRHPKLSTSAREIDENGEVSKFYFRPPGEAMVVFVPSTGRVHVRADTRAIRHIVRKCFVTKVLDQDLSHQPEDFQVYDISRFLRGMDLPVPDDPDVVIKSASVIRLEASIGKLSYKLTLSSTITDGVAALINDHSALGEVLSNAVAIRFVEIAVRYRRAGRGSDETLDFTISDRNTSSLLSLDDPFERILGHRLLRNWNILVEGRPPAAQDFGLVLPAILALWDTGVDRVTGAWLVERKIDASTAVDLGFLVPMGWEDFDVVEEDGPAPQEASIVPRPEGVELNLADGNATTGDNPETYRLYRVRDGWVAQYLKSNIAGQFGSEGVEVITPNLLALGSMDIEGQPVPIYLARRLKDERNYADIDTAIRARSDRGTGLVLNAGRRAGFSFAENVLSSFIDHLKIRPDDNADAPVIDMESLRSTFLRHRNLAHGGETVELQITGEHAGILQVPGKGTIGVEGENRLLVLRRLVDTFKKSAGSMKTEDMIAGIEGQSLSNIFGKELWKKLKSGFLRSPKKGVWEIAR